MPMHPEQHEETPLHGGNDSAGIVRVGNTVRRPIMPWTPATTALLTHLHTVAPGIAPEPLGSDEKERTIERYLDGTVGHYPLEADMRSDVALEAAARLLRRFHDATHPLTTRRDLPWQHHHGPPEVICQSDFAPYNTIYRNGLPVALIDFDHAGPGPRLWDLAYAVYRFAPLASDSNCRDFGWSDPPDRVARARAFLDAYGATSTNGIITLTEQRIRLLRDDILRRAETDPASVQTHLAEDHVGSYNSDLGWIDASRDALVDALEPPKGWQAEEPR